MDRSGKKIGQEDLVTHDRFNRVCLDRVAKGRTNFPRTGKALSSRSLLRSHGLRASTQSGEVKGKEDQKGSLSI